MSATATAPPPHPQSHERETIAGALKVALRRDVRQYGMLVALAAILALFSVWTNGVILRPLNVTNLVAQNSYILILAIGMIIVIIAGHIDLSVGSIAAFIGAMSAVLMVRADLPWPLVVVLGLVAGAAIGAFQGYWIAYVGIPSFIVTLAGMLAFRGLTQITLDGQSIAPFPTGFQHISNGFLPEGGPLSGFHDLTLLLAVILAGAVIWQQVRQRRETTGYGFPVIPLPLFLLKVAAMVATLMTVAFTFASYKGVPVVLLILLVLMVVYSFVMRSTVVGRHIYAVGGNEPAARLSGVRSPRVSFLVFVNMGVLAALAGMVFAARLNAATPGAGFNFELEAIAAAFIGGASMSGGVGTVLGAVIGGLVLGVLNNGMSLVGLGVDYQQVIKGAVLLAAVGFDIYNKRRAGA